MILHDFSDLAYIDSYSSNSTKKKSAVDEKYMAKIHTKVTKKIEESNHSEQKKECECEKLMTPEEIRNLLQRNEAERIAEKKRQKKEAKKRKKAEEKRRIELEEQQKALEEQKKLLEEQRKAQQLIEEKKRIEKLLHNKIVKAKREQRKIDRADHNFIQGMFQHHSDKPSPAGLYHYRNLKY